MSDPINLTMPLEEAMRTQRAIRRLKPDAVDDAFVAEVLQRIHELRRNSGMS
jgi:methyl coenzyme M reductase gamma subunit